MTAPFVVLTLDDLRRVIREELVTTKPDPIVDLRTLPAALRRHAYACARTGELQASKRGKRWYAKQSALDAWLASGERSMASAVEGSARWLERGAS